jgi:hypothetical protein
LRRAELNSPFETLQNRLHAGSVGSEGKLAICERKFQRRDPDTGFAQCLRAHGVGCGRGLDSSRSLVSRDKASARREAQALEILGELAGSESVGRVGDEAIAGVCQRCVHMHRDQQRRMSTVETAVPDD